MHTKGNMMSKYYRELKDNMGRISYEHIEVDDIPEVKTLRENRAADFENYSNYTAENARLKEQLAKSDPWHPASDPPKPEDFEPTGHILVIGGSSKARCLKRLSCKPIYTHWRKITPP